MNEPESRGMFPLSEEEEEYQIRLAISMSLQDPIDDKNENPVVAKQEVGHSSNNTTSVKESSLPAKSERMETLNEPSPQMKLRRSMSIGNNSPPRQPQSTDCCDVKNALMLKDRDYVKCLVASWRRMTSPLHTSVRKGHDYCLEHLIKAFPDLINSTNSRGETPLYLAAIHSKPRALHQLIQVQADPNIGRGGTLETPLLAAVDNDHRENVITLLKAGADVNKPLNRGWTALHEAVYRGHSEVLGLLLRHGGKPNIRDCFGISPVFTSAACGRNECLKMLLHFGGDPNMCAKSKRASPLYEASKEGHWQCVETLLQYGANPHLVNCDGLYPIHIASYKGHREIVETLLLVTDRNAAETCGMSPIHSAAKGDHLEILQMLINCGYDVNITLRKDKITYRDRRQTALYFAVYNDSEEATELLLQAGANTELDYIKPLLVAVSHSQYDMTELLLSYGADVNAGLQDEGVHFPAAIPFSLKDYRMLTQVLISGCDVEKCFQCDMGDNNHDSYGYDHQRKSFCHFITEDSHKSWCGYTVLLLLKFVGNTIICRKIYDVVQDTEEWPLIKQTLENPRSLQHLCRLKIRKSIRSSIVWDESSFENISLPKALKDYLTYNDI